MKHDANSTTSSKRKRNPVQMKSGTSVKKENRFKTVMKSVPICRKRKEKKNFNIETATRDTIAETIAFVIQGQLTPIKPTPLPINRISKIDAIKRIPKNRCCKIQKVENVKKDPKVQIKTAKSNVGKIIRKTSQPPSNDVNKCLDPITLKLKKKITSLPRKVKVDSVGKLTKNNEKKQPRKVIKKQPQTRKTEIIENKKSGKEGLRSNSEVPVQKPIRKSKQNKKDVQQTPVTFRTNSIVKPRKKYVKRITEKVNEITQPNEGTDIQIKQEKVDSDDDVSIKVKKEVKDVEELTTLPHVPENTNCLHLEIKNEQKSLQSPEIKGKSISDKKPLSKQKAKVKKAILLKKKALIKKKSSEEKRKAKLIQFWNSPKRHREASLNALAKVHCLYENESKAVFDKIAESSIIKREPSVKTTTKEKVKGQKKNEDTKPRVSRKPSFEIIFGDSDESSEDERPPPRTLRDFPGLRAVGKHWDMHDSISSDNNSDIEVRKVYRKKVKVKKEPASKKCEKTTNTDSEKTEKEKPKCQKRRRKHKPEVFMDLKDMVVKKRMASLNASAILAASYSTEKRPSKSARYDDSSSYDSDSSAEEYFAATEDDIDFAKNIKEEAKKEDDRKLIEVHTTPNKKVAVILNQDTDVTITGVYVNSTTRSTHHEGYCSIAGMQYRISATSHTQTAATAVATETLLQSSSSSDNANSDGQSCSKSYTPLDALSSMQPPPGPGIHSGPPGHHAIPCNPLPPHQLGSPQHRQPPPASTFSSPPHVPPGYPPAPGPGSGPPSGEPGSYIHGYYQPAGPLITVPHGHTQPPAQQPPLTKSVPLSDTSPSSVTSSVHQVQPPPAPSSNNGDSSDNEVIITSVTAGTKEPPSHPPPANPYRYPQYSQYPPYPYPSQYYPTPPPPTPPYAHHELCYPTAPPTGPYVRHSKYAAPPGAPYHRYSYYPSHSSDIYPPPTGPSAQPSQQIVTASPVSSAGSYPPAPTGPPPPPTIMETYPPPPAPPTLVESYQPPPPHYYAPTYGLPPTCYPHSPTRAISYINATYQPCPCPLNTCPKNGHTGPLTGESKRSNISKDSMPLPPVALALPLEPASATGPPSPARGSAGMPSGGMPPPPSPAGANYHPPPAPAPKQESHSPEATECKVEKKRKARVGKAMVRSNMQSTMLLMCNPKQDYVKREIESPKDKEELLHKVEETNELNKEPQKEIPQIPEACQTTTCTKEDCNIIRNEIKTDAINSDDSRTNENELLENKPEKIEDSSPSTQIISPPSEEPLPPCIATVAENVKVKNMKRKQSITKEQVPDVIPQKKKKLSSYKNHIKKHTNCFKISNGKQKLVSKELNKTKLPKIKLKTPTKKKLNASKEHTNNRRIKEVKTPLTESNVLAQKQSGKKENQSVLLDKKEPTKKRNNKPPPPAAKMLDNLIAMNNVEKVIENVISDSMRTISEVQIVNEKCKEKEIKKSIVKNNKPVKVVRKKVGLIRRKTGIKSKAEAVPEMITKTPRKSVHLPKWSNGWIWEGKPYDGRVFINSDEATVVRRCYPAMRHEEGDIIVPGDCVLLKAGPRKNDLPYVAKIAALWENLDDGEMMMSLLWYYRPEHTEQGRLATDQPDEVFASRHKDSNSVACIDDKCYVLTFNEYCRYKKNFKRLEEGLEDQPRFIPHPDPYPRVNKQPPASNISAEMIFFCRKVYDFRQKRIMKNPSTC